MTSSIWQSLFGNVALIAILVVAWDFMSDWTQRLPRRVENTLMGFIMGAGAVASMEMAEPILGGLFFDLRGPLVGASAFFGGLPAVAASATLSIAYRIYLGGPGAYAGVVSLLLASAIGLTCHWGVRGRTRTFMDIATFGLACSAGTLLAFLTLPWATFLDVISRAGIPLFTLSTLSALMIGLLLHRELRQRELTAANLIYTAMVRELPDPLNVKDVEGRFIAANPATARLMRAGSADRLIGRSDHDFYPPELARSFRQDEISMLEAGEPRRSDQPAVLPDGSSGWLSTLKAPLRDQSGRLVGIITHNRDISEQMRHAQIKNEFISTVSHELRTPLTSIRGSLGLIAAGVAGELPPKAANLVKIAHSNSERLVHLINDILDMEKIESGKMTFEPQILLLRPIIEQAISGAANYLADKKVRIVIIDDTRRARVAVDPARMHQVLANLLSNAIKFSPPEGIVTVRLTHANGKVRIGVEDTGPGIPEAFRHRIFGKFEQADASSTRQVGGTGLGLSISKAIIDRMGGEISFETEVGQGTKFHVDLAEAEAAVAQAPVPQDARHGVLICASDADISTTLGALLDAEDLASDTAPDIESAKALLRTRTYAAVLLDIEIAGESGMQFFRDIRSGAGMPDIPVIILSARLDQARQTLLGAAVGLVDWLEKPVDPLRLHAVLETIFARVNGHKPAILHVEDDPGVLEVMSHGLGSEVTMTPARTLAEARAALDARTYAVVILDITLPDGSGLELLPEIPARTPVIVFSAAEADQRLGDGVKAAFTKTKASEIDVAALVKSFVVAKT